VKKSSKKRERKALGRTPEPHVGIFWLTNGKLLIDSTPLSKAQQYEHFRIHSGDHISVWTKLQQQSVVPIDIEYEEHPRGRVTYDTKTRQFIMLADQCILSDKGIISKIMSALKLPRNIEKDGDGRYRCLTCLPRKFDRRG
jgi:hypothetical protein